MGVKIKADGTGTLAIYTVNDAAPDDAPFTAPLSNLSRVRFHSNLFVPRIVATVTGTVTLPAMTGAASINQKHTVGAHGQSGIPMVTGFLTSPIAVTLAGSVPITLGTSVSGISNDRHGLYRWVTLGADETNVVLHENSDAYSEVANTSTPAVTLSITAYVYSLLLNGSMTPGVGTDAQHIQMTPQLVKAQRGAFRSDHRYLRASASGTIVIPRGKTTELGTYSTTDNIPNQVRYNVNGYSKTSSSSPTTFTAPITLART